MNLQRDGNEIMEAVALGELQMLQHHARRSFRSYLLTLIGGSHSPPSLGAPPIIAENSDHLVDDSQSRKHQHTELES